mmetsp:Transcript_27840/g.81493  ORF Transcript_27840/g.81493 Transcript_27840/m.81493 type:complete len:265 (-) Transcript_27840:1389-2183(-)
MRNAGGHQLPDHDIKGEDVGGERRRLFTEELRSHPRQAPNGKTEGRLLVQHFAFHLTEAKVSDLDSAPLREHHVHSFYIQVENVVPVEHSHALGCVFENADSLSYGQRPPGRWVESLRNLLLVEQVVDGADQEVHHHAQRASSPVSVVAEQIYDVRVPQLIVELGLALDLLQGLLSELICVQVLHCHLLTEVRAFIHPPESAFPKECAFLQLVELHLVDALNGHGSTQSLWLWCVLIPGGEGTLPVADRTLSKLSFRGRVAIGF